MKSIGLIFMIACLSAVASAQPNPDTLWTRTYGGSNWDEAWSVQQTADGGYIVAGFTYSFGAGGADFYLVKMNDLGDTLWTRTYGGSDDDVAYATQQTTDGGYIMAGYTRSFGAGEEDFYLVKTGPDQLESATVRMSMLSQYILYPVYPNPFNLTTTVEYKLTIASQIKITIYDILGRQVEELLNASMPAGQHSVTWGCNICSSGIYLIAMETPEFRAVRKAMFLR